MFNVSLAFSDTHLHNMAFQQSRGFLRYSPTEHIALSMEDHLCRWVSKWHLSKQFRSQLTSLLFADFRSQPHSRYMY